MEMQAKGLQIYVWGTGRLTGKVVGRWISECDITGYIDNDLRKTSFMGKEVFRPEEMLHREYDAIIVINMYSVEIKKQSEKIGLDVNRMIFLYNNCLLSDINQDYSFLSRILGEEYSEIVRNRYHIIRGTEAYGDLCLNNTKYEDHDYLDTDYVRIKCFELVVKEIRKRGIKASVAEAGVFKGEFAQYLNHAFSESNLYLFDTFEGFESEEAIKEIENGNASASFVSAYKDTAENEVMKRMEHPEKIIMRKGFFPATAEGINDSFVFVSLDMDFEESIYEGLRFFYPRMLQGGYIFVHDYNSSLKGVEKAVDRFEEDNELSLKKIPVCDANGTMIIAI